ncbi:MAG TPA: hypothetical protein VLV54_15165 [Thermoanaerobaculia bacterium]|nr:hypothetical protein [Thermoanaerobaculia bacterium]
MNQQIIWGCVNADGSIYNGTGFTPVPPNSPGVYNVIYSVPFKSTPAVVAIENWTSWTDFNYNRGDTRDNCVLVASDPTKFEIITGDSSGKKTNRNFSFIAVGEV